jgi:hypothetical protein
MKIGNSYLCFFSAKIAHLLLNSFGDAVGWNINCNFMDEVLFR